MNKKRLCRVLMLSIPIMLSLSLITSLLPEPYRTMTSAVQAVSEPSDGDAWTENDNATYPWTVSPTYPDTIEFVTDKMKAGSYSLRVNHTSTTTQMIFFLDLGSNIDLSSYWSIRFWIRFERASLHKIQVALANQKPWDEAGNYFAVSTRPHINDWSEVVVPLDLFIDVGSGASEVWTSIRYIGIYVQENVGSSDGTLVYVDQIRFIEEPTITQTNSLDSTALANLYSAHLGAEQIQVHSGTSYTGLYDWMNINGATDKEGSLQAEALAQSIFALCWLYDLTSVDFYLDKAKTYADWLLQFQNSTYGYLYYYYDNSTETFLGSPTVSVTGWALAGISWLYALTSNSTWQTMANDMRAWICDYMYVDETGWYCGWNDTSGAGYSSVVVDGMVGGGANVGLGYYYDKVSQNSTVKSQLDATYSYKLGTVQSGDLNILEWGTFEQSAYNFNGLYINAKGTMNNSTFWDTTVKYMGEELKQQMLLVGNGSATNYKYNCNTTGWDYVVNWGVAVEMPVLYKVYEEYDTNLLESLEKLWFDWLSDTKGSAWYIPFSANNADKSWTPTTLFVYAALLHYYLDEVNQPFAVSTDANLISSAFSYERLTLTINGTSSLTRVYCGDKGEPTAVYAVGGNVTWNCNASTAILTLNVTHASPARILIYWRLPGDLDSNGIVDIFDIGSISARWYPGPPIGPLGYDANYDLNLDGAIDIYEIGRVDNNYGDGKVLVTIPGDCNGDKTVDIFDIGTISSHWYPGPPEGPLGFDGNADINDDDAVDILDIAITSAHWGESW